MSPTLAALLPLLSEDVSARTYVVLATDRAPNCNENASCDSSRCTPDHSVARPCVMAVGHVGVVF